MYTIPGYNVATKKKKQLIKCLLIFKFHNEAIFSPPAYAYECWRPICSHVQILLEAFDAVMQRLTFAKMGITVLVLERNIEGYPF